MYSTLLVHVGFGNPRCARYVLQIVLGDRSPKSTRLNNCLARFVFTATLKLFAVRISLNFPLRLLRRVFASVLASGGAARRGADRRVQQIAARIWTDISFAASSGSSVVRSLGSSVGRRGPGPGSPHAPRKVGLRCVS